MLTLAQVLLALNDGDWMVSVDLQDAYFHIPILKSHRKYLRFVVGSQHYQFAALPFGLTSAPRVFTKVMSVVAAELKKEGYSSISLSGRLVDQSKVSGARVASPTVDNPVVVRPGFFSECAQISPRALSAPPVYRGSTGYNVESCLSSASADSGHSGIGSNVSKWSGRSSPQGPTSARSVVSTQRGS
ncbi:hypothetical protein NDU88_007347 [Pleurodeles waltl]|uniref:ribonuclease H n=1 Tax=Pleurodeles waltl TaxID=8319 RepID=A0AAV7LTG1_PLEWA|nr:hypothetical protein NDU88_007347 [Pleurodeles waltl]